MHKQVYDDIAANLNGITSNTSIAQVTGKFSFEPDELRGVIKDWLDLADNYRQSLSKMSLTAQIVGPGTEFASDGHATIANGANTAYLQSLQQKFDYCIGQAQRCQDALDTYLHVDHHEVGAMNQADQTGGL